jgi:hypothetical protein
MAHTNTTAKPLRLPAGFNNKYDYGLVTTQQRTMTIKVPAGFKICNLWLAPTQQQSYNEPPEGFSNNLQFMACTNTTANDDYQSSCRI